MAQKSASFELLLKSGELLLQILEFTAQLRDFGFQLGDPVGTVGGRRVRGVLGDEASTAGVPESKCA